MASIARRLAIEVEEVRIEYGTRRLGSVTLRRFQEEAFEALDRVDLLLLTAPTAAGKTAVLAKPLYSLVYGGRHYTVSTGVYPSKVLARDQLENFYRFLRKAGARDLEPSAVFGPGLRGLDFVRVLDVAPITGSPSSLPYVLLLITSDTVEAMREELNARTRFEALTSALSRRKALLTVFTVPEYPYLLTLHLYGSFEVRGAYVEFISKELARCLLHGRPVSEAVKKAIDRFGLTRSRFAIERLLSASLTELLFIDEVHLYGSHEIPKLLALMFLVLKLGGKVVLSSATPIREIVEVLKQLCTAVGKRFAAVDASPSSEGARIRKRTVVEFVVPSGIRSPGIVGLYEAQRYLPDVVEAFIDEIRGALSSGVKVAVLGDRLAHVFNAARRLADKGFKVNLVTSIKPGYPFLDPKSRLIVGSLAVSYGVDIEGLDYGVLYAKCGESLIQKIGRIGRHEGLPRAKAIVLVNSYVFNRVRDLVKERRVLTYPEFVRVVLEAYPSLKPLQLYRKTLGAALAYISLSSWVLGIGVALGRDIAEISTDIERTVRTFLEFLERISGIPCERVLRYVLKGVKLSPRSYYELVGLRDVVSLDVRARTRSGEKVLGNASFSTVLKNFRVYSLGRELYIDAENPEVLYPALILDRERVEILSKHGGRIVMLGYLLNVAGVSDIKQVKSLGRVIEVDRRVTSIKVRAAEKALYHVPVYFKRCSYRLATKISILWDAIPVYRRVFSTAELVGVLLLL